MACSLIRLSHRVGPFLSEGIAGSPSAVVHAERGTCLFESTTEGSARTSWEYTSIFSCFFFLFVICFGFEGTPRSAQR